MSVKEKAQRSVSIKENPKDSNSKTKTKRQTDTSVNKDSEGTEVTSAGRRISRQNSGPFLTEVNMKEIKERGRRNSSINSLYGIDLSIPALSVTRRVSMSSYVIGALAIKQKEREEAERRRQSEMVMLENTYRLEPNKNERFQHSDIHTAMRACLNMYLNGKNYDPQSCASLSANICDSIKGRVKQLNMTRYKIVCQVIISPKQRQGIQYVSKCLWDDKNDNFTSEKWENDSLQAVACVYGVYFE